MSCGSGNRALQRVSQLERRVIDLEHEVRTLKESYIKLLDILIKKP